ncbi:serine/threonine protein kinase [Solimonas aquatica]|uniref:Serine/threonine protein kinase n=1 Tax=Solimonas aquatica TaxID=489703 RepID=A0A1H9FQM4_9GAMM|nr:serine/threonine-protein kinase [Solimonas aquatica]SEQ40251.1 serine/threonine protein kinase [Solimonas aquatica]
MSGSSPHTQLWREAFALVDQLLEQTAAQRESELQRLAGSRPGLHQRVLELLQATEQEQAPGWFEQGPIALLPTDAAPGDSALRPAQLLGAYRLERPLGLGGMGEVWLARRADGLFEAPVALKLLHLHLAGSTARERFVREGRILGQLSHPGIARLLDAGVLPGGQLYLALEYVEGERLDQFCDAQRLDIRARLQLYLQVCEAVAHAHAHLVVHRDLKPGNVLVGAGAQVKLLDFGIATLVQDDEQPPSELTRIGGRALTPEYAAPEQINGQTVTVATDVYALGVMLYALLCGERPYGAPGQSAAQLERAALQAQVPPMSRTALHGADQAAALRAAQRASSPQRLRRSLRGDLDTIVAKALKKNPQERYASVAALADDLRRHLADERVLATPDSLLYRSRKFVRRHRLGVALAAVVLLLGAAGLSSTLWQAHKAALEASKATAVKNFLLGIFNANGLDNPDGAQARRTTAEQLLDIGARQIQNGLQEAPEVRAELLGIIAGLYDDLDLSERAADLYARQLAVLRQTLGSGADARLAAVQIALGGAQAEGARYGEAERTLREALRMLDVLRDRDSSARAHALAWLSQIAYQTRPIADPAAEQQAGESLRILQDHHPDDGFRLTALLQLARIQRRQGHFDHSEAYFRQALALLQTPPFASSPSDLANARIEYGEMLRSAHRWDEAEAQLREAMALYAHQVGEDHVRFAVAQEDLGAVLYDRGRLSEAKPLLGTALATLRKLRGEDDLEWTVDARIFYARLLFARGEIDAAGALLDQSIAFLRAQAPDSVYLPIALRQQAERLATQKQWRLAEACIAEARRGLARFYGRRHERYDEALLTQAELRLAQGRLDEAQSLYESLQQAPPPAPAWLPDRWLYTQLGLARVALARGDAQRAVARTREALTHLLASAHPEQRLRQQAQLQLWLGQALLQAGRADEAVSPLRAAVALREAMDAADSPWLAQARAALARAQRARAQH